MVGLEYYRLGASPHEEAQRMQNLYSDEGVDDRIVDEFGISLQAYATLPLSDITRRIEEKYTGVSAPAFGVIATYEGHDIGMAACVEKSFKDVDSHLEVEGINVGAWLLKQYRARGFGREILEHVTAQATIQSALLGRPVWTSIKPENHVSKHICEDIGFVEAGTQPDRPERTLYFLKSLNNYSS